MPITRAWRRSPGVQRDTHRLRRTRIRMRRRSWRDARASLRLHVGQPCFLQFLRVVLTTHLTVRKNQTLNLTNRLH